MAIIMKTQTLQVTGLARPAQSCRQLSRLVVKGQRVQEQKVQPARQPQFLAHLKPASLAAVVNALAVLPAHAEAGKIFDFNLTLPIMTVQFLLLMVFLEKTWFNPVGKALDDRDASLRSKLGSVKDNSGDLKKLQEEAEKVLREARQEAQSLIKDAKSKTQEEQGKKLAETKAVSCSDLHPFVSLLGKLIAVILPYIHSAIHTLFQLLLLGIDTSGICGTTAKPLHGKCRKLTRSWNRL
ncbi:TPA: hypothetical protein ACH3X3_014293 [Trebouxia sp. C0006]